MQCQVIGRHKSYHQGKATGPVQDSNRPNSALSLTGQEQMVGNTHSGPRNRWTRDIGTGWAPWPEREEIEEQSLTPDQGRERELQTGARL